MSPAAASETPRCPLRVVRAESWNSGGAHGVGGGAHWSARVRIGLHGRVDHSGPVQTIPSPCKRSQTKAVLAIKCVVALWCQSSSSKSVLRQAQINWGRAGISYEYRSKSNHLVAIKIMGFMLWYNFIEAKKKSNIETAPNGVLHWI